MPNWLQNALFMMAVSNSCMNPLVYGSYAINFRKEFCKCLSCFGKGNNHNDVPSKITDYFMFNTWQADLPSYIYSQVFYSGMKRNSACICCMLLSTSLNTCQFVLVLNFYLYGLQSYLIHFPYRFIIFRNLNTFSFLAIYRIQLTVFNSVV